MTTDETMKWVIDWWLPKGEFRRLIDDKTQEATLEKKEVNNDH